MTKSVLSLLDNVNDPKDYRDTLPGHSWSCCTAPAKLLHSPRYRPAVCTAPTGRRRRWGSKCRFQPRNRNLIEINKVQLYVINNFTNLKYALICSNTHRILELPATSIERHSEDDLAGVHASVDVEVDAVEHVVQVTRMGRAVRHLRIG